MPEPPASSYSYFHSCSSAPAVERIADVSPNVLDWCGGCPGELDGSKRPEAPLPRCGLQENWRVLRNHVVGEVELEASIDALAFHVADPSGPRLVPKLEPVVGKLFGKPVRGRHSRTIVDALEEPALLKLFTATVRELDALFPRRSRRVAHLMPEQIPPPRILGDDEGPHGLAAVSGLADEALDPAALRAVVVAGAGRL